MPFCDSFQIAFDYKHYLSKEYPSISNPSPLARRQRFGVKKKLLISRSMSILKHAGNVVQGVDELPAFAPQVSSQCRAEGTPLVPGAERFHLQQRHTPHSWSEKVCGWQLSSFCDPESLFGPLAPAATDAQIAKMLG